MSNGQVPARLAGVERFRRPLMHDFPAIHDVDVVGELPAEIEKLTQRKSEVLLWIAMGKSNRDIGEILGLSARTVTKHLEQIYVKLGVENRASAAVKAAHVLHET